MPRTKRLPLTKRRLLAFKDLLDLLDSIGPDCHWEATQYECPNGLRSAPCNSSRCPECNDRKDMDDILYWLKSVYADESAKRKGT